MAYSSLNSFDSGCLLADHVPCVQRPWKYAPYLQASPASICRWKSGAGVPSLWWKNDFSFQFWRSSDHHAKSWRTGSGRRRITGVCASVALIRLVMSATETGIAEDDAAAVVDAQMAEKVVGIAKLAADVTKFSNTEIRSKKGLERSLNNRCQLPCCNRGD